MEGKGGGRGGGRSGGKGAGAAAGGGRGAAGGGGGGSGGGAAAGGPAYATRPSTWGVDICTDIGGRDRQEDRYYVRSSIPLGAGGEAAFFGVWDGTVCPYASDFVHTRCCDHHLRSAGFADYNRLLEAGETRPTQLAPSLAQACREGYAGTDGELLESCRQLKNHYTSCTSVTALVASGILTVAHLGDSRVILLVQEEGGGGGGRGGRGAGKLRGAELTTDHKPDDPEERRRILESGGSIEYLHHHNNKPFIRGGDFDRRKKQGERVMQLQYSRAFGGKDLKPYGLSADPSVRQLSLAPNHVGIVLASDGVCDVASGDDIALIVGSAFERGEDAAAVLVHWAMK
eukprot:g4644.t1